jgi:hypothetical protein
VFGVAGGGDQYGKGGSGYLGSQGLKYSDILANFKQQIMERLKK